MKHSLVFIFFFITTAYANAAVEIQKTRVIYNESDGAIILIKNTNSGPVILVESWIESADSLNSSPFIIAPPLFRLDVGQRHMVKIERISKIGLPGDRESLFWVNINAIPSQEKDKKNKISFSLLNRIKLFYRPSKIKFMEYDFYKKVAFTLQNGTLYIKNETPFHINFYGLWLDDVKVKNPGMLPPFGGTKLSVNVKGKVKEIRWEVVNDMGGISHAQVNF